MGELHLEIIVDRLTREFKVEANVGKPAGRLPRDHHQAGRRRGQVRPGRPAAAASTATCCMRDRAAASAARASSSRTTSSAASSRRSSSRRSRRASARRCDARRARRLSRWSTSRSRSSTAATTRSTRREMAFEIAGSHGVPGRRQARGPDPARADHGGRGRRPPSEYMGDVIGDLNSRRGKILGMEPAR